MTRRLRSAVLVPVLTAACHATAFADQPGRPSCLMQAPRPVYAMPPKGFIDMDDGDKMRACGAVSGDWVRGPVGAGDLAVNPAGPEGSGRYWTITVGFSPTRGAEPIRGVCMLTSTAGFRSLRSFGSAGLPWVVDRDGDNAAEFVLWTSFFLTPRLQQSETGLVAWVYKADTKTGRLLLDLPLSRRMADEIATAYKTPPAAKDAASAPGLAEDRKRAAAALEDFAADRCAPPPGTRR